jgi:hypothetical protein
MTRVGLHVISCGCGFGMDFIARSSCGVMLSSLAAFAAAHTKPETSLSRMLLLKAFHSISRIGFTPTLLQYRS